MKDPRGEAGRWFTQAQDDFRFAMLGLERCFYARVAFCASKRPRRRSRRCATTMERGW